MANGLCRRVARLERITGAAGLVVVLQESGETQEQAVLRTFGPNGPPAGAQVIVLTPDDAAL